MNLTYQDIFVPGGFPQHTYNPRDERNLEARLSEVKHNLCKLVTVTGHTKSGKTVLSKRIFPAAESVWIDGGAAATEDDFWQIIIAQLGAFQTASSQSSTAITGKVGGKAAGETGVFFAKAAIEGIAEIGGTKTDTTIGGNSFGPRVAALAALRKANRPLVVDDFHYIPREIQGGIIRALKPLIFEGLPVVIIAIPHRRYDALKVEREMTGRLMQIEIQPWSQNELISLVSG
jgi:hypothetical protein